MGQAAEEYHDEGSDSESCERISLQKKTTEPRFYVIKDRRVLTGLTRLVFALMTLFSMSVVTVSIWLMMDCRHKFARVRPLLPRSAQFCTNMGMPALFACCTLLFAIFGLGCTGRRLTGYALIIISSVEILQSVTALTFYKCNALSRADVASSVNSSLLLCSEPDQIGWPFSNFALTDNTKSSRTVHDSDSHYLTKSSVHNAFSENNVQNYVMHRDNDIIPHNYLHQRHRNLQHVFSLSLRKKREAEDTFSSHGNNRDPFPAHTFHRLRKHFPKFHLKEDAAINPVPPTGPANQPEVDCALEDFYFASLASQLTKGEVNTCLQTCRSYQTVCSPATPSPSRASLQVPPPSSTTRDRELPNLNTDSSDLFNIQKDCAYKVYTYVTNLCYYDNKIILPISLSAPLLCIAMSICFIYFAYCDRRIKEESESTSFVQMSESNSTDSLTPWMHQCCCLLRRKLETRLSSCNIKRSLYLFWVSSIGRLRTSASTQELLRLQRLPSSSRTNEAKLSTSMSQVTLSTNIPDNLSSAPTRSS